jgi:hypothetical protein
MEDRPGGEAEDDEGDRTPAGREAEDVRGAEEARRVGPRGEELKEREAAEEEVDDEEREGRLPLAEAGCGAEKRKIDDRF